MAEATIKTETILDRLVAGKVQVLELQRKSEPLSKVRQRALSKPAPIPFRERLRRSDVQVIAEIKRASPSQGIFEETFDPSGRATRYAKGGAAAISVLTEEQHFLGSLAHLEQVRKVLGDGPNRPPLLRKDFLFDAYQLYEARAAGADAVLLIVAVLSQSALADLIALANDLRLDANVEVHDEVQTERALLAGASMIGVNNRDLRTFEVDLGTTARLKRMIPTEVLTISESGIHHRSDVERMGSIGIDAVLIGEALMRSRDIVANLRAFTGVTKPSTGVRE